MSMDKMAKTNVDDIKGIKSQDEAEENLTGEDCEQEEVKGMQDTVELKGTKAKKKRRKRKKKTKVNKSDASLNLPDDYIVVLPPIDPDTGLLIPTRGGLTREGEALQIVSFDNGICHLHEDNLKEILMQDDVKNRLLVVVSVVGKFRQGKSFLQTFMLNHMQRQRTTWISDSEFLLDGFEWKHTSQRVTTGIMMWSQAFPVDLPTGEKCAVVFMDTQGTFDRDSNPKENTLIFAISTMMSSVQIYNLKDNMGGDDLDHFQYFAAYGRMTREEKREENVDNSEYENEEGNPHDSIFMTKPPFQHLRFLIRDWCNTQEFELGADGGNAFLKNILNPEPSNESSRGFVHIKDYKSEIMKLIESCFTQTECFLLSHPGLPVTKEGFKGKLADVDPDFKKYIFDFLQLILDPSKLVIKEFGGQPVKARNFIQPVKDYVERCKSGELPAARNVYDSYADACFMAAAEAAVDEFTKKMDAKFLDDADCVSEDEFEKEVVECKKDALRIYYSSLKIGESEERNKKYLDGVVEAMRRVVETKKAINKYKLIQKDAEEERAQILKQDQKRKKITKDLAQKLIQEMEDGLLIEMNELKKFENISSDSPKSMKAIRNENRAVVVNFRKSFIASKTGEDENMDHDDQYIKQLKSDLNTTNELRRAAERRAVEEARAKGREEQAEMDRLNGIKEKSTANANKITELTNKLNEKKKEDKDSEVQMDLVNKVLEKTKEGLEVVKRRQEEERREGYLSIAYGFLASGALATAAGVAVNAIVGTSVIIEAVVAVAAGVGISAGAAPVVAGAVVLGGMVGAGLVAKRFVDSQL